MPEMVALGMPYLFRDDDHYWKVLLGPIGRELGELPKGMRALTYYDSGRRSLYTVKKPVHTPDDVRGLKVRTQQSRCAMDMILALGGAPTPIPWGELYTALSQGTVDGAENNLPSFDTGRHLEVCRYFIMTEHSQVPDMLMISRATWESLSPGAAAVVGAGRGGVHRETARTLEGGGDDGPRQILEQGVKFLKWTRRRLRTRLVRCMRSSRRRSRRSSKKYGRWNDASAHSVRIIADPQFRSGCRGRGAGGRRAARGRLALSLGKTGSVVRGAGDRPAGLGEFLGIAAAFEARAHLGLDFLAGKFAPGAKRRAALFGHVMSIAFTIAGFLIGGGELVRGRWSI